MDRFICVACGTQYPDSDEPPATCPICLDPRQYVPSGGQRWTTLTALREDHATAVRDESGLVGIATEPQFAIGQRALLVPYGASNLLWDCVTLLDDATAERVAALGGIEAIAISHPHYYSAMVDWAERFDARILLHAADREWIMRPSPRIDLWPGERHPISGELELIRLGGHFAGGTVCLWRRGAEGRGGLLSGVIVQVVDDRDWVSFMWSYPNLIPLPAREVQRIRRAVQDLTFERVYGAWWHTIVASDAHAKVIRSAERYVAALDA